ncbi:MAG: metallophosphoesterase family protein [Clostridia bacterium]|nr:metallophosphoesterase family protein [Clostridia bacterium]
MRILLISDIHSNLQALEAVLRDAGTVDAVWCAGDLVDYGTDPHGVVTWFRTHDVQCVSGNHDRHLLNILDSGETETLRGTDRWKWVHDNCERISPEDAAYLSTLPVHLSEVRDGIAYLISHQMEENPPGYGMPESVMDFETFWNACYRGEDTAEKRMIFGHTHRRCVHMLDDHLLWMNPGSVSYRRPDDPDKTAHYLVIQDGRIQFHSTAYDRSHSLARAMEYLRRGSMMETELQDAMFFFGNARTSRDPLPVLET